MSISSVKEFFNGVFIQPLVVASPLELILFLMGALFLYWLITRAIYWAAEGQLHRVKKEIVISEPDVQMALSHLQSLPLSRSADMPQSWSREWVLQCIREELNKQPHEVIDQQLCFSFGPGLWAIVKPFGVDLLGFYSDKRLQVWVMKRDVGTDPNKVTKL